MAKPTLAADGVEHLQPDLTSPPHFTPTTLECRSTTSATAPALAPDRAAPASAIDPVNSEPAKRVSRAHAGQAHALVSRLGCVRAPLSSYLLSGMRCEEDHDPPRGRQQQARAASHSSSSPPVVGGRVVCKVDSGRLARNSGRLGRGPPCWGRGYATEGAAASIDWAFDNLGWTEVIHTIAPDNIASQGVARGSARATVVRESCRRHSKTSPSMSGVRRAKSGAHAAAEADDRGERAQFDRSSALRVSLRDRPKKARFHLHGEDAVHA